MIETLQQRAKLLANIRSFFATRDVLEVETALLSPSTIPDPNIHSFSVQGLYLQTSPEFAMKKLLSGGSGSIYQICKAFRNEEYGKQHNHEFTILEWYRVGFNHHDLMDEMDELLNCILATKPAERLSYQEVFKKYLNIDPHNTTVAALKKCAHKNGLNDIDNLDYDGWLNILLTHFIEPYLGKKKPTFIYNFPISQAALAKIKNGVAERFEVYINGIELANGFHELADAKEQHQRFLADLEKRQQLDLPQIPIDHDFLQALNNNFPSCAGVALGIDRLLMLLLKTNDIHKTMALAPTNVSSGFC